MAGSTNDCVEFDIVEIERLGGRVKNLFGYAIATRLDLIGKIDSRRCRAKTTAGRRVG